MNKNSNRELNRFLIKLGFLVLVVVGFSLIFGKPFNLKYSVVKSVNIEGHEKREKFYRYRIGQLQSENQDLKNKIQQIEQNYGIKTIRQDNACISSNPNEC